MQKWNYQQLKWSAKAPVMAFGQQLGTMQHHAVPSSTMQYRAKPCNTKQNHAIPCNTMQYNAISCNTMQYHAIPCNTMQYYAIPCNTMQYHAISWMLNNADGAYHCPVGSIMAIFSSVRSSYSHPDLLLIHHDPTFSDHTGPQHWTFTFWATTAISRAITPLICWLMNTLWVQQDITAR